jgi:hypothetical protein
LPQRFVPLFPGIKADWSSVKDEYISKGYEALVKPYEKAFQNLINSNVLKPTHSTTLSLNETPLTNNNRSRAVGGG